MHLCLVHKHNNCRELANDQTGSRVYAKQDAFFGSQGMPAYGHALLTVYSVGMEWHAAASEMVDVECSPIKRYLLKEVSGEFPIEADMKLAMTLWADAKLRLVQPPHSVSILPAVSPASCSLEPCHL